MSNSPEDFEKLRKLLKIKRHEQPPPGYFNNFSGLVISRIERQGDAGGALSEVPWLRKLFRMFEASPVVGGLFGSALCALAILGIMMANQTDKVAAGAYRPPGLANNDNNAIPDSGGSLAGTFALAIPEDRGRSTDAMFGSTSNGAASSLAQPVAFKTSTAH